MPDQMVTIRQGYIAALTEQVVRDEQTLRQAIVDCPGRAFYAQRVAEYKAEIARLRAANEEGG